MLETFLNPPREQWVALSRRPSDENPVVRARVEAILQRVREQGDDALRALALEIEGRPLEALEVTAAEKAEAAARVSDALRRALAAAKDNIRAFHE
ncbi:MAG: histidinol dehydrogenase, partial [Bacteroidales bacterium]|nr:histidinol dehydrogenase [Bacteroidales bacterium]